MQQVCLHMHYQHEPHLQLIKRILCYLNGTLDHRLQLGDSFIEDLITYPTEIGLEALTPAILPPAIASSLEITSSRGPPSAISSYHSQV